MDLSIQNVIDADNKASNMPILSHRFGQTTIAKLSEPYELRQLLVDPWLQSETVIIKPNFVATDPGYATDSEAFRMLLEALDSRVVVTEAHMVPRSTNLIDGGMSFTVEGEEVNWMWLMGGDGWRWLLENPDWGWFREGGHWDHIKKEDKAFLDERGFTDLFREFDVEYVNVTDEVWSGRIANPAEVKGPSSHVSSPLSLRSSTAWYRRSSTACEDRRLSVRARARIKFHSFNTDCVRYPG